jgi:hypothetical protein
MKVIWQRSYDHLCSVTLELCTTFPSAASKAVRQRDRDERGWLLRALGPPGSMFGAYADHFYRLRRLLGGADSAQPDRRLEQLRRLALEPSDPFTRERLAQLIEDLGAATSGPTPGRLRHPFAPGIE